MSDTTTGKTCFYCNHPGPYLGMPEDEEVNLCACCSWVDGHEKRSECFEYVERERDEARAEAHYAAIIIDEVRGMVDGEAFTICEDFSNQWNSPVSPVDQLIRERDEARAALTELVTHIHTKWQTVESSPYRNALGDLVGWMTDQDTLRITGPIQETL